MVWDLLWPNRVIGKPVEVVYTGRLEFPFNDLERQVILRIKCDEPESLVHGVGVVSVIWVRGVLGGWG